MPSGEAALYLREHAGLSRMVFGGDGAEKALALRLLDTSRFHPLLMDRLARLATGGPALRPQLLQALATLESSHDYAELPALFATVTGDAKELGYLTDALATSLDQLIRDAGPDARRLLWMIAVANDPVSLSLFQSVWSVAPARPDPTPLLRHLVAVGLVTEERTGPDDDNPDLTCHELVCERISAWMRNHSQDRADLTENTIRLAYAERLEAVLKALQHQNMSAALEAGSRALVYCVEAGAYDRLGRFASRLVTSTGDPRLLADPLPHLEAAAEAAPEGQPRWSCLYYLADAVGNAGRPDASLPFYAQAAIQARTAAEARGENGREAWADVASITANWANALRRTGDLDASRQRHLDSAEAEKKAGRPAVYVIGSELATLGLDIMRGQAAQALPQVEAQLAQVEAWWQQHRSGQPVPEAPDPEYLARALISASALDIAKEVHVAQQDWEPALRRIDAILAVKRALGRPEGDIAVTRTNRAIVLTDLDRVGEAKSELETCLQISQNNPAERARTLQALASLFNGQGDVGQAITQQRRALALCEQLPDPLARAGAHNNLANYLECSGTPSALAEYPRHQLAALIYCLVAGLRQGLQTSLGTYAIDFRRAQAAGTPLTVPRVVELLAEPAFHPLDDWLDDWLGQHVAEVQAGMDQFLGLAHPFAVAEVQAGVDQFLDVARQLALEQT
ncbi:MAG: tetratricopeptide repeat protein [Actinomycetota bacterium]